MKRDMDLLRDILLTIEKCPDVPPKTLRIESFSCLCGSPAVISMHIELLIEAGLIEAKPFPRDDYIKGFDIVRITFAGYDYLDSIRNAKVWYHVKEKIAAVGGATMDIIKAAAIEEVKKELNI